MPTITRAHLKNACDQRNWDLLDKLLEIDDKHINDNALFTDEWGEYWGLLCECITQNELVGVQVLLARGAKRQVGRWGDGLALTAQELAQDKPEILALLQSKVRPVYVRQSEPELPMGEENTAVDIALERQAHIRDQTGLLFPPDAFLT
jgi:hypothetical protein